MINRVVLVGRMTRDPQLKKAGETSVCNITVACDRRGRKVEGQPTADFINVVCWGKTAENTSKFTHKGSLVGVEGRIQTRSYEDKDGKTVYITEVVADSIQFLDPKNATQAAATATAAPTVQKAVKAQEPEAPEFADLDIGDDDLPF